MNGLGDEDIEGNQIMTRGRDQHFKLLAVNCNPQNTLCMFHRKRSKKSCQAVPSTGMRLMQTEGRTNAHPHLHSNLHLRLLHLVGFRTDLEIRNQVDMNKGDRLMAACQTGRVADSPVPVWHTALTSIALTVRRACPPERRNEWTSRIKVLANRSRSIKDGVCR